MNRIILMENVALNEINDTDSNEAIENFLNSLDKSVAPKDRIYRFYFSPNKNKKYNLVANKINN